MRCPSCNKFASYDDPPTVEVQSTEIEEGNAKVTARVVLLCAEDNTELKESTIEAEASFDHTCTAEGKPQEGYDPETDSQFEADDPDGEGTSRQETTDRKGKPIKNPRYMKTYYGFEAEVDIRCRKCGDNFQVNVSGEEQASGFDECC